MDTLKQDLHRYLHVGRDALRWKLDGLTELDARRSLTPTGLNLLGLVHHVAVCAAGYFGEVLDRPFAEPLPDVDADPHADFVVPADVSLVETLAFVDRAWAHADATIETLLLDAPGHVPWWPGARAHVTLELLLVHMVAETHRHAGHADILRERLDGSTGLRADASSQPDATDWTEHVSRVDRTAREAGARDRA